ncbi:MAG: CaiB/BaiF CoA transferase family protein [Thermoplasmatota archaeon]
MTLSSSLSGIVVLDLTRLLPGPFATAILAELGARVIKIEEPATGDYARTMWGAFEPVNRGKESVALDLKTDVGRGALLALVARSHVLIESFRPGVLARLGLDDAALHAANPLLVVVHMSGYGATGPRAQEVGHDVDYQAVAGIVGLAPAIPTSQVGDLGGALYAAFAIVAALRKDEGMSLDLSLFDAAVAFNVLPLARAAGGDDLAPGEYELAGRLPGYGVYACSDGKFVALGALEPKFWAGFCAAAKKPEWEERIMDADARGEVAAWFASRTRDAAVAELAPAGVPVAPVLSPAEALADAQTRARLGDAKSPSPGFPLTLASSTKRAPALGEHTLKVLAEFGVAPDVLAKIRGELAAAIKKRVSAERSGRVPTDEQ